jgi:hypothetical protein
MAETDDTPQPATSDLLAIGELRPLTELATEYDLNHDSLRKYAQKGRLAAVKFGFQWASTRAAVEHYLATRYDRSVTSKKKQAS